MVEFRLLGPLEVVREGEPVAIRGTRQRALLASLLLSAGRPVTADVLVRSVWGSDAGAASVHGLHEVVSQLRRTLAEGGLDDLIETQTAGSYVLNAEDEQLDSRRFEKLASAGFAETDPGRRSELLRAGLDLWRGPALGAVVLEGEARNERDRLDELRLAATATWIDTQAQLGNDALVIPELERLTGAYPLHERFREQLMLALYRQGRQAEALREYRETRRLLSGKLGLEPSEGLRDLEHAILRHDPSLAAPRPRPAGVALRLRSGRLPHRRYLTLAVALLAAGVAAVLLGVGGRGTKAAVLADSLKGTPIDTQTWDLETIGQGVAISPTPDGVLLTIPAHATPTDATGQIKAHLATYCSLLGSFDVQVDYRLRTWPPANGVSVGMYAAFADLVRESNARRGEQYVGNVTHFDPPDRPPNKHLPTHDTSGTLRITRTLNHIEEQVRTNRHWQPVYTAHSAFEYPAAVYLEAWTNSTRFAHREVDVEFSNFRVNEGTLTCPQGAPATCCPTVSSH